ncbi:MAG TPA: LytR C-terminal domain-containing protein, partial [Myxococcaceae bacterium]|nr:LytR C-terminal domain-containing protein [Myxococcaceae bacterium]
GGVDFDVAFGPVQGPRVQVLGVKGTPPESFTKVQAALEGAGFAPIADGEAKARHPTTVIFAAKGFEAEAKKAAAVLPDAKVDKLTWKPGYELVVVIGGR